MIVSSNDTSRGLYINQNGNGRAINIEPTKIEKVYDNIFSFTDNNNQTFIDKVINWCSNQFEENEWSHINGNRRQLIIFHSNLALMIFIFQWA